MRAAGWVGLIWLALAGGAAAEPNDAGRDAASAARSTPAALARARITVQPLRSTAATRAADRSRRALLVRAAALGRGRKAFDGPLTKDKYVAVMRSVWRNKDWNEDGVVSWAGPNPPENLADVKDCVIVKYQHEAASKTKDKANPGKYIETPERWLPVDWLTYLEVLASTKFEGGECQAVGLRDEEYCVIKGKAVSTAPAACAPGPFYGYCQQLKKINALGCAFGGCAYERRKACEAQGGAIEVRTKMEGCERWEQYGPDSEQAFLRVAEGNFAAEDLNGDGAIGSGEGEYLCRKPA